jgi:membrane protein
MIALRSATPGRVPRYAVPEEIKAPKPESRVIPAIEESQRYPWWSWPWRLVRWMYRGYTTVNAGDMAAAVAFNTLVALVPMLLLLVAISGLFLRNDTVLEQARQAIERIVPGQTSDEAFTAALSARGNTGFIGLISFIGLAWVGTGLISCLARSMNKIYGARSSGYINEKQRGFLVLMIFSFLFLVSSLASILPTFFISQDLPEVFDRWILASGRYQLIGYGIGLSTSLLLFLTLYRVIPNAGQRVADVWPGTIVGAILFLAITQVFPLYIRFTGGGNRYGQVLGFVSLLVASLLILAHIILFGAYINASWQRHRRLRRRRRLERAGVAPSTDDEGADLQLD